MNPTDQTSVQKVDFAKIARFYIKEYTWENKAMPDISTCACLWDDLESLKNQQAHQIDTILLSSRTASDGLIFSQNSRAERIQAFEAAAEIATICTAQQLKKLLSTTARLGEVQAEYAQAKDLWLATLRNANFPVSGVTHTIPNVAKKMNCTKEFLVSDEFEEYLYEHDLARYRQTGEPSVVKYLPRIQLGINAKQSLKKGHKPK